MELCSIKQRKDSAKKENDTEGNSADERTRLLTDASIGARSKTTLISGRATINNEISTSSSHYYSLSKVTSKAAYKASKSAFKAAAECDTIIKIAMDAIKEGEKRIDTALDIGEKVHHSHISHYLGIGAKCRITVCNLSERVREAEKAQREVETAANNVTNAESKLSALAVESNVSKGLELWVIWATNTAYHKKIDAYKAAYLVLKATNKFWQEMEGVIDLESRLKKSVQPPKEGTSELTDASMATTFLVGCTLIGCYFYVDIKSNFKYLQFLGGCACITGSVFAVIIQAVRYCTSEENSEEKAKIAKTMKDLEERLKKIEEYFARNKRTPPLSDSSEDELNDFVVPSEIPATQT